MKRKDDKARKGNEKRGKLKVNKETVRELSSDDLSDVAGGHGNPTPTSGGCMTF